MDGGFYLVQVYSSGCQNCKDGENELSDAGKLLEGVVKVGKADVDTIQLLKSVRLPANPTYVLLKGSLASHVVYDGKISRIAFCKFVVD